MRDAVKLETDSGMSQIAKVVKPKFSRTRRRDDKREEVDSKTKDWRILSSIDCSLRVSGGENKKVCWRERRQCRM